MGPRGNMKSSWVAPSERVKVCKRCGQNPTLQKRALDMCAECERNLHQDSVDEKGRGGRRAGRKSNRELMRDAERRKEREADRDEVVLEVESGRDKENHRDCLPPIVYPDSMREKEGSCFRPRARSSGAKNAAEQPAASSQAGASDDFTVLKSDASDDDEDEEPAQVEIDEEELVADSEQEEEMGEYDANVEKVARDYIEGQSVEEDEENSKDDRRVRFDEVSAGRNSNTHLPVDLILRASKITALARGRGNCGIMRQLRDVLTRGLADHSAVVSSKSATAGAAAPEVDAPESDRPDRASITTEVLMRKPAVELVANPSTRSAAKTTGKTTNQTRAAASKSGKHNRNSDSSSTKGGEHDSSTTSTSSSSDEIALVCDGKKSAFAFVHYLQRHFILHRLPFPHSHPNLRLQTYEFAPLSRFDLCVLLDNQLALKTASSRGAGNRQMPDVLGVTGVCVLEQIVGKSSLQLFDPVLGESVQLGSHCAWSAPLKTGDRFCLRSLMRGGGGEGANGMQRFVVMNVASNLCGNSYGGQQQAWLRGETGVSSWAAASAGGYSTGPEDASTSAGDTGGATTATEDAVAGEAGSAVTEEDGAPVPVPEGVIISRDHEQDFDTGGRKQTKQRERKSAHNKNSARPRQLTKAGGGRQRSSTGASSTAGGASVVVNKSSQLLSSARIVSSKARKFTSHLRYDVVLESEFLQGKIENVICNLPMMVGAGGAAASAATGECEREGGGETENETIDAGSVLIGYDLRTRVSNELEELERADRMFPSVVLICRSDASFSSDRSPSASPAKEVCAELAADLTRTLNKL